MNVSLYLRVFLSVTLIFGALHIGSLLAFLYSPQSFYYGAWEYFGDLAYRVKGLPVRWDGFEYQNQTRKYFFYYQQGRVTTVTADNDGFRTRRYEADYYPVSVVGDSATFGATLSDAETLPWRLAELLDIPVFNAGRTSLSNALKHPVAGSATVIIDAWTERDIWPRQILARKLNPYDTYSPIAQKDLTLIEAVARIPPRRYSLPLIAGGWGPRVVNDIKIKFRGGEAPYLIMRHKMRSIEMDETVALIVERSRAVTSLGKRYVFLPIPEKQTIYAPDVDDYTRNFIPLLVARLSMAGVDAIDLATPFQEEKDRGLFFAYDTHWNANGADLAARVLARHLFEKLEVGAWQSGRCPAPCISG